MFPSKKTKQKQFEVLNLKKILKKQEIILSLQGLYFLAISISKQFVSVDSVEINLTLCVNNFFEDLRWGLLPN